ncbi:MAG: NrfD/PsrC family molybdoenzyme membrane anchor subunit [Myxococcota bacterium]
MTEIDLQRHSHLIDPSLHIWGWEIPVYLFLGGVAAGVMVWTSLLFRRIPVAERSRALRWLPFATPVALSLGMLALLLDLANPLHVPRFYATIQLTSPMSWGSWILLAIYPVTLLVGVAALTGPETKAVTTWAPLRWTRLGRLVTWGRRYAQAHDHGLLTVQLSLGLALGVYTGVLLGALGARAVWSSAILPPLFLVSGLSTGAALMMLMRLGHDEHAALRRWDMVAIGVELALLLLYLLGLSTSGATSRGAAELFLGGRFTGAFWALVVLAGLLVPFALETVEGVRRLRPTVIAPVLLLVGGLSLRWLLVLAGQA